MFDNTTLYRLPSFVASAQLHWLWQAPKDIDTLMLVDGEHWETNEQQTAEKLIQAIQLSRKNSAIAALEKGHTVSLARLHREYKCRHVIVLGISAGRLFLQVNITKHQPIVMDGLTIVAGYSVPEMNREAKYKAALWKVLQNIYKLS